MNKRRLRIAIVMDPIEGIKPAKDSTLAMMLAAQKRGHELFYLEQRDLWLRDGVAWGRVHPVEVRDHPENWATVGAEHTERLASMDVILMRKDPPFDMEYIYTTYILERAEAEGVLVANRPQGLRDMNEKVFTAWFPFPSLRSAGNDKGYPDPRTRCRRSCRLRPARCASRYRHWRT